MELGGEHVFEGEGETESRHEENANGVPAQSPGLRACATPGINQQNFPTARRLRPVWSIERIDGPQPRCG